MFGGCEGQIARTKEAAARPQGLNIHETDTLDSLTLLKKDFRGTWCEIDMDWYGKTRVQR